MKNYFKTIIGSQSEHTLRQEFFHFDDANPEATRAALKEARAAHGGKGIVSVWRWAVTVPMSVPEVGMSPKDDVLKPGQREGRPAEEAA